MRPAPAQSPLEARVREELASERAHYTWTGPGRGADDVGRFSVHARRIACRGADSGMSVRVLDRDKLRAYQRRLR